MFIYVMNLCGIFCKFFECGCGINSSVNFFNFGFLEDVVDIK